MNRIFIILILLVSMESSYSYKADQQQLSNKISVENLKKNLFRTNYYDKDNYWVSVGMGAYIKQYYSRDTFVAFMGASRADELRPTFSYAIDWFSKHQLSDGYIPIWFQESMPEPNKYDLNIYLLAPYNLTEKDGGIRQVDTILQYIDAICIDYEITNNKKILLSRLKNLERAIAYIESLVEDGLITTKHSIQGGPDWADLIRRSGKSSFLNGYWFYINKKLIKIYEDLNFIEKSVRLISINNNIYKKYNELFWVESKPTNCELGSFGHYLGWIDGDYRADYFEIDSNSMAIISGLADINKSETILKKINENFDYFINKYGATKNICGYYNNQDTRVPIGEYQNGGFWYIPIYYLAQAEKKMEKNAILAEIIRRVDYANIKFRDNGLKEWYFYNSDLGGAENYTWSLALPLFLHSL